MEPDSLRWFEQWSWIDLLWPLATLFAYWLGRIEGANQTDILRAVIKRLMAR